MNKLHLILTASIIGLVSLIAVAWLLLVKCKKAKNDLVDQFEGEGEGPVKIEFYSMPDCPYCKEVMPTWEKVVASLSGESGIELVHHDHGTEEGKKAADKHAVTAFPHFQKVFPDGTVVAFKEASRTEENLIKFATDNAYPAKEDAEEEEQ